MSGATVRVLGALALLGGLLLLAADLSGPVLGEDGATAAVARVALGRACHQRPERALKAGGVPLAACARCTGLHASAVAGGACVLLLPGVAAARLPRRSVLAVGGALPLLADVAAGTLMPDWDHPWLRLATGLVAGTALLVSLRAGEA